MEVQTFTTFVRGNSYRAKRILELTSLLYSIRRLNKCRPNQNKALYTLILSPLLLTLALCKKGAIAQRYRRFLLQFTYGSFQLDTPNQVYEGCTTVHDGQTCMEIAKRDLHIGPLRVVNMYVKYHIVRTLLTYIFTRRLPTARRLVEDTLRSSLFLATQTLIQRIGLCWLSKGKPVENYKIALLSILSGSAIFIESPQRVRQVVNLVLVQLILGWMRQNDISYHQVTLPMFLITLAKDDYTINKFTLTTSAIASLLTM